LEKVVSLYKLLKSEGEGREEGGGRMEEGGGRRREGEEGRGTCCRFTPSLRITRRARTEKKTKYLPVLLYISLFRNSTKSSKK
jgi:hypothetical protein